MQTFENSDARRNNTAREERCGGPRKGDARGLERNSQKSELRYTVALSLLVPELSVYLYQSFHFTCTRALTLLTICYVLVYLLCQVTVVSLGF
jgi:hypothetical protein